MAGRCTRPRGCLLGHADSEFRHQAAARPRTAPTRGRRAQLNRRLPTRKHMRKARKKPSRQLPAAGAPASEQHLSGSHRVRRAGCASNPKRYGR